MTDDIDAVLVVVPQTEADDDSGSEEEQNAQRILFACTDFFTEISLLMRKLLSELPDDLQGWFPEIAGGALQAQVLVILHRLKTAGDQDSQRIVLSLAEQIATRANTALDAKRPIKPKE